MGKNDMNHKAIFFASIDDGMFKTVVKDNGMTIASPVIRHSFTTHCNLDAIGTLQGMLQNKSRIRGSAMGQNSRSWSQPTNGHDCIGPT
jgi:hypothetical protein